MRGRGWSLLNCGTLLAGLGLILYELLFSAEMRPAVIMLATLGMAGAQVAQALHRLRVIETNPRERRAAEVTRRYVEDVDMEVDEFERLLDDAMRERSSLFRPPDLETILR